MLVLAGRAAPLLPTLSLSCAVSCHRGINDNSLPGVEKVFMFVCKCLRSTWNKLSCMARCLTFSYLMKGKERFQNPWKFEQFCNPCFTTPSMMFLTLG